MRVTPPPPVVPRLTVLNSRKRLPSPMMTSVCSPVNFKSCGLPPTEQNESKMFLRPNARGTSHHGVRLQNAIVAEIDLVTQHGKSADTHVFSQARARGNDGARIDVTHRAHQPSIRGSVACSGVRFAINQHAAQHGFRHDVAIHSGHGLQLAEFYFPFQHGYFDAQLVPGDNRAAKSRFVHGSQIKQLFVPLRNFR